MIITKIYLKLLITFISPYLEANPAGVYLFNINNRNVGIMCKISLKLKIEIAQRRHSQHFSVFIVNLEQISHIDVIFPLLTWTEQMPEILIYIPEEFLKNCMPSAWKQYNCHIQHLIYIYNRGNNIMK